MGVDTLNPNEEATVGRLLEYCERNRKTLLTITYENGEQYLCRFCTAYDSDNEWAVDKGTETELLDYLAIAFDPIEDICPGPHHSEQGSLIELSYRDFPERIVAEDGTVVYGT